MDGVGCCVEGVWELFYDICDWDGFEVGVVVGVDVSVWCVVILVWVVCDFCFEVLCVVNCDVCVCGVVVKECFWCVVWCC